MLDLDSMLDTNPNLILMPSIEVVEPVGTEALWYLKTGKNKFVSRVDAHAERKSTGRSS